MIFIDNERASQGSTTSFDYVRREFLGEAAAPGV